MKMHSMGIIYSFAALAMATFSPASNAQPAEVKEKPPMYSYIANWQVPREKTKEIGEVISKNEGLLKKMLAEGAIIGYGNDTTLVHKDGESTHDTWWSSMSWGGLMKVLEAMRSSPASESPVLNASKHDDKIYAARYYNWKSGPFTNGYTRLAVWKLKPSAPDNAVDQLAKSFVVPMFERLLENGSIYEYEIDEEAVHSEDPATFLIIFVGKGPEGLDKASSALTETSKSTPFGVAALDSWVDSSAHRDGLYLTTAVYK